nr:MAG TPA: helix-turn-helix domain protein [Caudoviricetes sp.]
MQETLADKLKKIRGNESRKSFSLKYGIHEQSLIRYEKGTRIPDNDLILRIANGEGVSVDWLLANEGPMYKTDPPQNLDRDQGFIPIKKAQDTNFIESTNKKNLDHDQGSFDVDFFARYMKLAEEHAAVIRENADLRVQAERHLSRIRDLERENEELRRMRKGASRYYDQAGQDAG